MREGGFCHPFFVYLGMESVMKYDVNDLCPYKPIHTEEWLEAFFAKNYFKKPYDRFMWWRSYTPKTKPLIGSASPLQRIQNGDFDPAPYKFEAEVVEHRLRKKWFELKGDWSKFLETCAVDLARRKRLLEDHDKEETKRLEGFYKYVGRIFSMDRDEIMLHLESFGGETVLEFYEYLKEKNENKPY